MRLDAVVKKNVSYVELKKDEIYCLGLTIADGTNNESGPTITDVIVESPAGKSFAIGRGDVILSLNGISAVRIKRKDIIRLIEEARNGVVLELEYQTREIQISEPGVCRTQQLTAELEKRNNTFGFILRKHPTLTNRPFSLEYPVISNIEEGSHIYRSGLVQEGDRLLKVDDRNLFWLSLADIAGLLQRKDKAYFTFEYDVRDIDFEENETRVDLHIDLPDGDLGVRLRKDPEGYSHAYIANIQTGSIAERCGAFCRGDIVLSINNIDTKYLTASQAGTLLNGKNCRNISFIPSSRNDVKSFNLRVNNNSRSSNGKYTTTVCLPEDQTSYDWMHVNTPASSTTIHTINQDSYFGKIYHTEQEEIISKLQNVVKVMITLKENLSQLNCEDSEGIAQNFRNNCLYCNESHYSVFICAACLSGMIATCTKSIIFLRNIISSPFTYSSRNSVNLFEAEKIKVRIDESENVENELMEVSTNQVVHALTKTLPRIFSEDSQLEGEFNILASKIIRADSSCNICGHDIKSVWTIVQQLLCFLNLDDDRSEIKNSINHLLDCLLDVKFSCESRFDSRCSLEGSSSLISGSVSSIYLLPFSDDSISVRSAINGIQRISEFEIKTNEEFSESNLIVPIDVNEQKCKNYLKITHIQSCSASDEFCSENGFCEVDADSKSIVENSCVPDDVNIQESFSTSFPTKDTKSGNDKNIYKDKWLGHTQPKMWSSLDSILRPMISAKEKPENQSKRSPVAKKNRITKACGKLHDVPGSSFTYSTNNLSSNHRNDENNSHSNSKSTRSSFTNSHQTVSQANSIKKVRTDTVEVKLSNKGEGFGIILGVKYSSTNCSIVPYIHSIKPKSPSQRSGILKIDDRVIAINQQSTIGLRPSELQILKKFFLASDISLTVEFDVAEEELKFGTFDVVLDKTLKIGLVFEDMKRGFPMFVSGIVKGSGAHRCGQLFPGDKIKFFRCIRNEEFDPVSCNYSREESVLITIQRDPKEGSQPKPSKSAPNYFNPCFSHRDSVPRKGATFVVQSTTIHSVGGTEALVLDQDVTLFRDPVYCDFGFLVGENPDTGRAYVTDVRPGGPAFESGVIKKFDRIVEVNGILVDKNLENSVLTLLSQANHKVDLLIRRLYREDLKRI